MKLCIEELAYGDGGAALNLDYSLTREQLEHMCQPLVARSFDVCEDAMKAAGLRPTQLDNVILVGGSTRIPLLQRMVAEYFGRNPRTEHRSRPRRRAGCSASSAFFLRARRGKAAALGRVALKKVAHPTTGSHPRVTEETSFEDDVTNVGERPPLPPPPVARAARKATLPGSGTASASAGAAARRTPKPADDGLVDTPTRSRERIRSSTR